MLEAKLTLKSITKTLSTLKSVYSIVLIGSFADGVEDEDSDIDLFVVVNENSIDEVKEILYSNNYTCDSPLILSRKELFDEIKRGAPNITQYVKAGKIISDSGLIESLRNKKFFPSYESLVKSLEEAEEDLRLSQRYLNQKFVARAIAKISMAELAIHEEPYTSTKMGLRCIVKNHGLNEAKILEEVYKKIKRGESVSRIEPIVEKVIKVVKNEAENMEKRS
jgi:hypothetical protein